MNDLGAISGSREPNPQAVSALTGFDPGRVADLELALDLACRTLGDMEPPDSRAVSSEFVAMFSVLCRCTNDECRDILRAAIANHEAEIGDAQ